jgi:phage baseplate assembly protein W
MAYKVQKIDPLDLQPRKAIGVSLPFSARAVFHSTYQSKDAIRSNLINYFLTGKNERVLNLNFGASLRNLLFENITQDRIDEIRELSLQGLEVYFPRVVVKELTINSLPDSNLVNFLLKYSVSETNISDEIVINFEV